MKTREYDDEEPQNQLNAQIIVIKMTHSVLDDFINVTPVQVRISLTRPLVEVKEVTPKSAEEEEHHEEQSLKCCNK